MEIIKDITQLQWNKTSVTLGKFDGVHLGHRMLMENVAADLLVECFIPIGIAEVQQPVQNQFNLPWVCDSIVDDLIG